MKDIRCGEVSLADKELLPSPPWGSFIVVWRYNTMITQWIKTTQHCRSHLRALAWKEGATAFPGREEVEVTLEFAAFCVQPSDPNKNFYWRFYTWQVSFPFRCSFVILLSMPQACSSRNMVPKVPLKQLGQHLRFTGFLHSPRTAK